MNRLLRASILVVLAGCFVQAAGDEKFGKGVSLAEATPIKALYDAPEKFVGKTIRVDGVVSAVCEEMGCWMALASSDKSDETIRLKVDHEAGIVFPISAKGKSASAEGMFEKIGDADKEAKEAAAEQAAAMTVSEFGKKYQIKATGAIVR